MEDNQMNKVPETRLHSTWWALRLSFGLVPFLAGLDKFFNILADWTQYQSPILQQVLPVTTLTFMHIVGVIEMIVGIAILTRWTRVGSYVAMAWLIAIAANLVTTGRYFDIAVRDLVMAVGAYSLATLTEIVVEAETADQPIHAKAKPIHGLGLGA
jgi:uncharacterized membrane protein YphA (DoxX/SURF4 family)